MAALSRAAVLERRAGCLYVGETPVLWPDGAVWDEDARSVTFVQEGKRLTVRAGGHFPALVGAGVVPLRTTYGSTTPATRQRATECLGGGHEDVLVID